MLTSDIKKAAIILLLLNGIGALYGGWNLIAYPDGSSFKMPISILKYSPFSNFYIPGIILFTTNGLLSLFVLLVIVLNIKNYALLIVAQGALLTGWIVVEVIMLKGVHYLHVIFGAIGLTLIICGLILKNKTILTHK
jgi:hypothetical protein